MVLDEFLLLFFYVIWSLGSFDWIFIFIFFSSGVIWSLNGFYWFHILELISFLIPFGYWKILVEFVFLFYFLSNQFKSLELMVICSIYVIFFNKISFTISVIFLVMILLGLMVILLAFVVQSIEEDMMFNKWEFIDLRIVVQPFNRDNSLIDMSFSFIVIFFFEMSNG